MCTSIVEVADACRAQPVIETGLEPVPRSGIVTLVPFVPEQPGGGGGSLPSPTKSSRFGEPVPGLPTTPVVALDVIEAAT